MAEPANRQTNKAGGKYYVHPVTGEKFDSVTTILDLVDKAALKIWAGMVAADFAMDNLPQLLQAQLVKECGNTFNRCFLKHGPDNRCERCPCGDCERCWWRRIAWRHEYESKRRAQEGTDFHEAADFWVANGGRTVSLRPEVQPYFGSFLQWTEDYGLTGGSWEQTEVTLINREHKYAGTSDGAVWLRRGTPFADEMLDRLQKPAALVRIDYKTREKGDERLFYDMPLQGVAYERARVALLPDGTEHEAPRTDARAILQLRPAVTDPKSKTVTANYSFKLMLSDDPVFEAFLGVLQAYRWINGPGKKPFDQDLHFPLVAFERAVETVRTVLDAEVIPDDPPWDPDNGTQMSPEEAAQVPPGDPDDDVPPWATNDTLVAPARVEPLPPLPPPPPAKKATKKAAGKVSATQGADPFALAGGATLASMSASTFKPGPRQSSLLDEEIPF